MRLQIDSENRELNKAKTVLPLAVGVLDVEPNHIDRNVEFIKLGVNVEDVVLVVVIPTTLVVSQ